MRVLKLFPVISQSIVDWCSVTRPSETGLFAFLLLLRREKKLFTVECDGVETSFVGLDLAMAHAKMLNKFVVITGDGFEVVGKFGVDTVKDGLCPDGVAYDWNKASRIGRVQRERG